MYKIIIQFIKFGIVGLSNTIISLLVYYILIYLGIYYIVANIFGFFIGIINSYYWNQKYVFKESVVNRNIKNFLKVFISYTISFIISTLLIFIFVDVFRISEWLAPLIRLLVTVPLNFTLNKFWAFSPKK